MLGASTTSLNSPTGSPYPLGSAGASLNEPVKESEFDREGRTLSAATETLHKALSHLETKLQGVLHPSNPTKSAEGELSTPTNTALGSYIRTERVKVDNAIRYINEIADRVGI